MLTQALFFSVGLIALYFGAEWLVRGAARMARTWGISALVVGLTVVAAGTSAPELVVSILASLRGQSDVAVGNVVGSNILNIGLVLGLAAAIYPLRVEMSLIRRELPIMIAVSLLPLLFGWNGLIGRPEALLLLLAFLGYLLLMIWLARQEPQEIEEEFDDYEAARGLAETEVPAWKNLGLIILGLALLVIGAQFLVGAAVFFARALGVPDLVVGLTVVAIGTSLPELAASLVAAFRREADIAIGNVVGSNIFNILLILGGAALTRPVRVAPGLLAFEIPVMIAAGLVLLPFTYTRLRIDRWEGVALLCGYAGFTAVLIF